MKEMKGRKRREREWKSQPGKWRRSRRAPSGKFGSGIREFYHGVQWPTQVSAHVGSDCLPLLAERKRAGVDVSFFFFFLWVIKRPLVQVSILSAANARHYEWAIKFLQDLLFDMVRYLLQPDDKTQLSRLVCSSTVPLLILSAAGYSPGSLLPCAWDWVTFVLSLTPCTPWL